MTSTTTHPALQPTGKTRRAIASVNRQRILEAAREALSESGDATMQSIAKRIGIGQGTLYRHFPTREALVMAVHRRDVADLVESASELLKSHPPFDALRLWCDQLASYGRLKHGLAGALYSVMRAELGAEGYEPVIGAIAILLRVGQAEHVIRPDVEAEELLLLLSFLWRIDRDPDWDTRSSHMMTLVLDGLRARQEARSD